MRSLPAFGTCSQKGLCKSVDENRGWRDHKVQHPLGLAVRSSLSKTGCRRDHRARGALAACASVTGRRQTVGISGVMPEMSCPPTPFPNRMASQWRCGRCCCPRPPAHISAARPIGGGGGGGSSSCCFLRTRRERRAERELVQGRSGNSRLLHLA